MKALGLVISEIIFLNFSILKLFSDPLPYFSNQQEPFNHFARKSPNDHSCVGMFYNVGKQI